MIILPAELGALVRLSETLAIRWHKEISQETSGTLYRVYMVCSYGFKHKNNIEPLTMVATHRGLCNNSPAVHVGIISSSQKIRTHDLKSKSE